MKKLCVIQVAALGYDIVQRHAEAFALPGLAFQPLTPCFPAVTCTAQATFRTGRPPAEHGVVCNGVYNPDAAKVDFWNQSAHLLPGGRIWDDFRLAGGTVGSLCWQQSLGDAVDLVLSPAPIHKHHGGMIQDCYCQPAGLYAELCAAVGAKFNLFRYWGPTAGLASTRWIAEATAAVLRNPRIRPDLLLTYLPHLDYVLQKRGPAPGKELTKAVAELVCELRKIIAAAKAEGYAVLLWGDYAITPAKRVAFPNRALRKAGLFRVREVGRMTYPDLFTSRAFAMADHQIAHVYVREPDDLPAVRKALAGLPGVGELRTRDEIMRHLRAGELILVADQDAWFAYPWWEDDREAPDFATHVDIHNKIGFDPGELFWGKWLPPSISLDAGKVRGTHGLTCSPAAQATDVEEFTHATSLDQLAQAVARWLS